MPDKRISVRIKGRVQGVFFRDHTEQQALRLNLRGWVRNLPDGSVEAEVEGETAAVETMIEWFHQGSPLSQVSAVQVVDLPAEGKAAPFLVRYD
jgi:acylphosphatase